MQPAYRYSLCSNFIAELHRGDELDMARDLRKPFSQPGVLEAIKSVLGIPSTPSADAPISPTPAPIVPLRILLAEDNEFNQRVAIGLLSNSRHNITVVQNGQEALARIEAESFDLVLMDLQMPVMDGIEATRTLRQREVDTGTHLPVIGLTARAMENDRQRCLDAGMDDYLTKPFKIADLSDALGYCGGDVELLSQLIRIFIDDMPDYQNQLRMAIKQKDPEALRHSAHAFKSSLATLGLHKPLAEVVALEELGRNDDLNGAISHCDALEQLLREMTPLLVAQIKEPE